MDVDEESTSVAGSRMSASKLAADPMAFARWQEAVGVLVLEWKDCPPHIKDNLDCRYFNTCKFPASLADKCIANYHEYKRYQEDLNDLKTSVERTLAPSDKDLLEIDFVHVDSMLKLCETMAWANERDMWKDPKINEPTLRGAVDDFVSSHFAEHKTSRESPRKFDFRKEFQFRLSHPTPVKFSPNSTLDTSSSGNSGLPNPRIPTMPPVPSIPIATSHAVSSGPISPSPKQSTLSATASLDLPSADNNLPTSTQAGPSSAPLVTARQSVQRPLKRGRIASSEASSKRRAKATASGLAAGTTVTCDTTVFCAYKLAPFQAARGSPLSAPAKSLLKRLILGHFDIPCFISEYKTFGVNRQVAVRQFMMDSSVVLLNRVEVYGEEAILGNRANILHILLGSVVIGDIAEIGVSWLGKDEDGKLMKYTSFSPQKFKLSEPSGAYSYWLFLESARRRALWVDELSKADYSSSVPAETVEGHQVGGDGCGPESGGGGGQGNENLEQGFFNPATWSHKTAAAGNDRDGQGGCETREEDWCVAAVGVEGGWFGDEELEEEEEEEEDMDTDTDSFKDSLGEWAEEARNVPAKYLPVDKVPLTQSSLAALSV